MKKKETYQHLLPHFQHPGQPYLVTFCLWDSLPHHSLPDYIHKLRELRLLIEHRKRHHLHGQLLTELTRDYYTLRKQYMKAYDDLPTHSNSGIIDLNIPELSSILKKGLSLWEGTKIENYAWCIMPNHVHWVFKTRERDINGQPVYLSDIMESVKKHTAKEINKAIGSQGYLWQKENLDTTILDDKQLYHAIEYTLNNPVAARYVKNRNDWPGSWGSGCL